MAAPISDDRIPPGLATDEPPFDADTLEAVLGDWHSDQIAQLLEAWADDNPDDYVPTRAAVMRWEIRNDGDAEWAMAMVADLKANDDLLTEQEQAYLDRIRRHYADAHRRLAQRRAFFEVHLTRYAAAHRALDPKRNKTLRLVSGTVASTEHQPKAGIEDEAKVIEWARGALDGDDLEQVVKVKESAAVLELRKRVKLVKTPAGYEVTLDCGHVHLVPPSNPATGDAHTPEQLRADGMPCDECEPDPIDGHPWRAVTEVADWDMLEVRGPDGKPVPGAKVEPGGVSYTVKPS